MRNEVVEENANGVGGNPRLRNAWSVTGLLLRPTHVAARAPATRCSFRVVFKMSQMTAVCRSLLAGDPERHHRLQAGSYPQAGGAHFENKFEKTAGSLRRRGEEIR